MASCRDELAITELELPREFEDIEGLLQADLRAIVVMLSQRAHERLLLTRRESRMLRMTLWNRLATVLNESMVPLSAENR